MKMTRCAADNTNYETPEHTIQKQHTNTRIHQSSSSPLVVTWKVVGVQAGCH